MLETNVLTIVPYFFPFKGSTGKNRKTCQIVPNSLPERKAYRDHSNRAISVRRQNKTILFFVQNGKTKHTSVSPIPFFTSLRI